MDVDISREQFEQKNDVKVVPTSWLYKFDRAEYRAQLQSAKWTHQPNYFTKVEISVLALLKMIMHCRSGGRQEVMGIMLGKIDGSTMYVMDAFALPVEGTETRVNAQAEAYEYMTVYAQSEETIMKAEPVLGWYHSHPGYGCWLSGIDVETQLTNQTYQDPYLAIVIDPIQTASAGKVCLGAFRCYPEGYSASSSEGISEFQAIPMSKIEEFGVHSDRYYSLEVSYFKSLADQYIFESLWRKYWANTLASSPLFTNSEYLTNQIKGVGEKLAESMKSKSSDASHRAQLANASQDATKVTVEILNGLITQTIKQRVFRDPSSAFADEDSQKSDQQMNHIKELIKSLGQTST